ncbi:Transcriptional regulator, MarR family [[Actinomadura] parvosata subsp. kistnae]|uniref:MarR family transcriptional regulator n=2 Tax=Nonomuraea TaxID=83681 RepID=A0A1V0A983_9ACTN|nr:MarR family transcriptional regulator [Nonomuraea sp. ATCC 55076]AQZ66758.1 MarR family transcriptional regulator [Nonomuraea sp. ATCC 55076]SPL95114.1 Transcriptional regulator, MarR family [Actinomadura parvosata subsp. kistnae]
MTYEDAPEPLRALPSRMLSLLAMYADRLVSEGLAAEDARKWHYAALVALREHGPMSQAELSRRTGVYRSDMVAVVNELEERGHVERAPDPADRRRNVITMTTTGRRHLERLDELISGFQDDLLAPLTGPEREQFSALLARLLAHHSPRNTA